MKTDALFYELFKTEPRSLFELVNLDIEGEYAFESITVKATEKRPDGFFRRTDGDGANVFSEFQGYDDDRIYWRFFREIFTWHEQTGCSEPFVAVILFVNKKYDPGNCPVKCVPPHRMIRANLADCLKKIKGRSGALTVLKPLLSKKKELPENVRQWKTDIESAELSEDKTKYLLELLEYAIVQRFPKLSLKEVQKMLELTPLEKTVAGQELIQIGKKEGIEEGIEKGKRKGKREGKRETAANLLKMGVELKIICQATGLSEEEIKKLLRVSKRMKNA